MECDHRRSHRLLTFHRDRFAGVNMRTGSSCVPSPISRQRPRTSLRRVRRTRASIPPVRRTLASRAPKVQIRQRLRYPSRSGPEALSHARPRRRLRPAPTPSPASGASGALDLRQRRDTPSACPRGRSRCRSDVCYGHSAAAGLSECWVLRRAPGAVARRAVGDGARVGEGGEGGSSVVRNSPQPRKY